MPQLTTLLILAIALIAVFIAFRIGYKQGAFRKHTEWEQVLMPGHRKDAISRSRAVIGGQFSENLAPFMPDYPFLPTESKFLGKPIDLIVFKGMDEKDINEVVFCGS